MAPSGMKYTLNIYSESVNKNSTTCQVYFYGNDPSVSASTYKRLKLQETVHWSSIIGTAKGQFIEHYIGLYNVHIHVPCIF